MDDPTKEEAAQALRDAAYLEVLEDDEREPRALVHTFAHGPGMALGADWDLPEAVAFVERADSLAWVQHPLRHDLEVRADGRLLYFAVRRPQ